MDTVMHNFVGYT